MIENLIEKKKLNRSGSVSLVEETMTGRLLVRKELSVYNSTVYEYLLQTKPKGIPKIIEIDRQGDMLIVMEEYIQGTSLSDLISSEGPVSLDRGIDILKKLCAILAPLHKSTPTIIHRDIKPSNIIITPPGDVYLVDFNAATEYDSSKDRDTVLIGTAGYAAPEQYGFKASDPRTDVYAIGRVAQELLTGERSSLDTYNGPLKEIVKKCLNLDPNNRYGNAGELGAALSSKPKPSGLWKKRLKYAPPGFRTGAIWKMLIASLWYYLIFYSFVVLPRNLPILEYRTNISYFIFCVLETFIACNYLGLTDIFPIASSRKPWLKALGRALYMFIFFMLYVFIMSLLENAGVLVL